MNFFINCSQKLLYIIILVLIFTQCEQKIERKEPTITAPVSLLALGDSYTIGTGINPDDSWPYQLGDSLSSRNFTVDSTVIIATNGWTTTDLLSGIDNNDASSAFNLVSILIGVNNQYQNLDLDLYRNEFRKIIEEAINFARGDTAKIFIVSIPNYGVTPFGQHRNPVIVKQEIEYYNGIAKEIGSDYDIPFINITPISELAANDSTLLAQDNLHPSAKMYAMWINEMLPTVTQILQAHE